MRILVLIALIASLHITEAYAANAKDTPQAQDIVANVVCGKSEQVTPCVLILNKEVPSYELTVKNAAQDLCVIKVERVEGAWKIQGETRHEGFVEVVVDAKDGSCTVFNPRRPDLVSGIVPDGCTGLLIRTVEVKPSGKNS